MIDGKNETDELNEITAFRLPDIPLEELDGMVCRLLNPLVIQYYVQHSEPLHSINSNIKQGEGQNIISN